MNSITDPQEIPYGLCHCGCGGKTNLASQTRKRDGWIKGQPLKFILGHTQRVSPAAVPTRFWSFVDRSGGPDACWLFTGTRGQGGYGQIQIDGKRTSTHRYAYQLAFGEPDADLFVLHKCDQPSCCNPAHLFTGTHADNMADMTAKGRQARGERSSTHLYPERVARGERNGSAKLTYAQARQIILLYEGGGVTQAALARRFGVTQSAVSLIICRKHWQHIE